jgi:hypothetical protein
MIFMHPGINQMEAQPVRSTGNSAPACAKSIIIERIQAARLALSHLARSPDRNAFRTDTLAHNHL